MNTGTMRAQGVCKSFGKKAVLRELELTLEPGKIYGLLGRNGAGKTTLLSILTAQLAPERGSVTYGGEPVWENQAALDHLCFPRRRTDQPPAGTLSPLCRHFLSRLGRGLCPPPAGGVLPGSLPKALPALPGPAVHGLSADRPGQPRRPHPAG